MGKSNLTQYVNLHYWQYLSQTDGIRRPKALSLSLPADLSGASRVRSCAKWFDLVYLGFDTARINIWSSCGVKTNMLFGWLISHVGSQHKSGFTVRRVDKRIM